ncbi:MAG: condensation domain-containing protein, partial [Desulfobacterales bacterium]|nr:condensation domain-containing protein [Desulfobacterales bacterium]
MNIRYNPQLYPLTSTQREIWFDQILHPGVPLYNLAGYVRIDGPIDPTVFEKAVNQVVGENDAMRIVLRKGDPLPMQSFEEDVDVKVDFHDFSGEEDAHGKALDWMQGELV